jgi:hypothetical protein
MGGRMEYLLFGLSAVVYHNLGIETAVVFFVVPQAIIYQFLQKRNKTRIDGGLR